MILKHTKTHDLSAATYRFYDLLRITGLVRKCSCFSFLPFHFNHEVREECSSPGTQLIHQEGGVCDMPIRIPSQEIFKIKLGKKSVSLWWQSYYLLGLDWCFVENNDAYYNNTQELHRELVSEDPFVLCSLTYLYTCSLSLFASLPSQIYFFVVV